MSQFFKDKGINFNAEALLSSVKEGATKVADTSSKLFDRARQFTEENFRDAPKTELEGLEDKIQQATALREQTEALSKSITKFVNPGSGLGITIPKIDRAVIENIVGHGSKENVAAAPKAPEPPKTPYTDITDAFQKAATAQGPLSAYGRALSAIAEAEQDLGKRFVEFRGLVMEKTVKPLEDSLQNELKEAEAKEHSLRMARLDLDAAKRRVREANTADKMSAAEADMRKQEYNFNKTYDDADAALDKLQTLPVDQIAALREFMEQQRSFHAHAQEMLDAVLRSMPTVDDVQSEVADATGVSHRTQQATPAPVGLPATTADSLPSPLSAEALTPESSSVPGSKPASKPASKTPSTAQLPSAAAPKSARGRALYDYEPTAAGELELTAGEEVTILQRIDADWVLAEAKGEKGKVPIAYLLIPNKS